MQVSGWMEGCGGYWYATPYLRHPVIHSQNRQSKQINSQKTCDDQHGCACMPVTASQQLVPPVFKPVRHMCRPHYKDAGQREVHTFEWDTASE